MDIFGEMGVQPMSPKKSHRGDCKSPLFSRRRLVEAKGKNAHISRYELKFHADHVSICSIIAMESDHDVIVSINFDSSGVPRTKADYIETSYTKARRQASIISLPPRTILKSCPSLKDVYALHSQSMVQKNIPSNRTVFFYA